MTEEDIRRKEQEIEAQRLRVEAKRLEIQEKKLQMAADQQLDEMVNQVTPSTQAEKSKVAAGLLGIFLGAFGIHKFYIGATGAGVVMLLISVLSCFVLSPIMWIIGFIEGIVYLTKSDEEFHQQYTVGKKGWF